VSEIVERSLLTSKGVLRTGHRFARPPSLRLRRKEGELQRLIACMGELMERVQLMFAIAFDLFIPAAVIILAMRH
jgi:hypothetical protein